MSKGLEALKQLVVSYEEKIDCEKSNYYLVIGKELKALDIIRKYVKEQVANIDNEHEQKCLLVLVMEKEKEYDLLKEVLL